jgi:CheY-like chemotaxis protein
VIVRILIIDDDEAVRRATKILLDASGHDAVAVADGKAGMAAVAAGGFDLAIVDLFMPNMDGLATTKAIHALNPRLPVIAVSGFIHGQRWAMPNFEPMANEAGAIATLYKPFRPAELLEAIRQVAAIEAAKSG